MVAVQMELRDDKPQHGGLKMPKAQLTEIEYYRVHVAELKQLLLLEKEARMREMQKNANLVLEITAKEIVLIGKEKESMQSSRTILFMEIGERLEATGKTSSWKVSMNHDTPTLSTLSWPEDKNEVDET